MIPTRVHVALYRRYLRLFPMDHSSRHGEEQLQLFADLLATGHRPIGLWIAAIADLVTVIGNTPRRHAMSHLARLALYPLSMLNAAAGLTLAAIATLTGAIPVWVTAPALAVAVQGLYTLAWLRNLIPIERRITDLAFAGGEAAALVIATTGLVAAVIAQNGTTDAEYGPPTILTLIAVHGLVGLVGLIAPTSPSPTATTA